MKLYDGAVIIMLGGTVLGVVDCAVGFYERVEKCIPPALLDANCTEFVVEYSETPAETCTRVMEEMGAEQGGSDYLREVYQADPGVTFRPGHYYLGTKEVICIPAPTGLKR